MSIPETPEELTPTFLTKALSAHIEGAQVINVARQPVGTGQMADTLRLRLEYGPSAPPQSPRQVIAKMHAADAGSRATGLALRSYEIEVRFYQEMAQDLRMRTPACYFADIDLSNGAFLLLLEDISAARQGDQLAGCSQSQAVVAIDELVRLHAPRWGDPTLQSIGWLHRDIEAARAFYLGIFGGLWEGFVAQYADHLGPDVLEAGAAMVNGLGRLLPADGGHWTVTHGDYRLDNLLFATAPGAAPVTVVDWQLAAHGPAMNDVAYFLGAGFLPEDRRRWERALVRRYHDGLVESGVRNYSWDLCWADYRRGTWSGLMVTVAASMLVERTTRGDDMFLVMAHRHARHVLDLDAAALL